MRYPSGVTKWFDDREDEMVPIVLRLEGILDRPGWVKNDASLNGEFQLALEWYLIEADKRHIDLPNDLINDVASISINLLPNAIRARKRELIPA